MVVVKGGGTTYSIGNGKFVASESELPAWFKSNMDMQETDGAGNARCVELRNVAQRCMEEKGSYDLCAALVEAYHKCHAEALVKRLPLQQQQHMLQLQQQQQQQQQQNQNQKSCSS